MSDAPTVEEIAEAKARSSTSGASVRVCLVAVLVARRGLSIEAARDVVERWEKGFLSFGKPEWWSGGEL